MKKEDYAKMTILICDDMFNMRRTIKNMLRHLGFENVVEAENGSKAWEMLNRSKIDIVISDWNMPELPGVELLRRVRDDARLRDMPFVMITAEVSESKIVQAAETEVDGYLIKPFVAKALEEKLEVIFNNRENPPPFERQMKAGISFLESGAYDKAVNAFSEALRIRPDSARARFEIGEAYARKGDLAQAERWNKEALSINPQYLRAYEGLSKVYEKQGKMDNAIKLMEKASEISPNNPRRHLEMGKLFFKSGDKEKGERALQLAMKNAEHNADINTEVGEVYLASGEETKAAAAFSSSLGINENVHVYNRLGIALRKKFQYEEAFKVYLKAIKLEPENEVLFFNIGRLRMEQEMFGDAAEYFKKALVLDPEFTECHDMLKKTLEMAAAKKR
jgi:tetratricopeptide (TPR) repeat protein